jgi:hypothetical protein
MIEDDHDFLGFGRGGDFAPGTRVDDSEGAARLTDIRSGQPGRRFPATTFGKCDRGENEDKTEGAGAIRSHGASSNRHFLSCYRKQFQRARETRTVRWIEIEPTAVPAPSGDRRRFSSEWRRSWGRMSPKKKPIPLRREMGSIDGTTYQDRA